MYSNYIVEEQTDNDLNDQYYDADRYNDQHGVKNMHNDIYYEGNYNEFNNNGSRINHETCNNNGE